jgi:hypothetical protein
MPITRLQAARQEIDQEFGEGFAAAHSDLLAATMVAGATDFAGLVVANAIERVAVALLEEPEGNGIVRASDLLNPIRPAR